MCYDVLVFGKWVLVYSYLSMLMLVVSKYGCSININVIWQRVVSYDVNRFLFVFCDVVMSCYYFIGLKHVLAR